MTVWVVEQGNNPPGVVVAIYNNEVAALHHVQGWDDMVLDHGSEMLRVVAWSVQSECPKWTRPLNNDSGFSCDWGDCDDEATAERLTIDGQWLPVCGVHGGIT